MNNNGFMAHAIWVRLTPYLLNWAEEEFGTGLKLVGKDVLELRTLPGVKEVLREEVTEDLTFESQCECSMSQLRYEVIHSGLGITGEKNKNIETCLPVHVPDYLRTANGVIRPFNRLMEFQHKSAKQLAKIVYQKFWTEVWKFSRKFTGGDIDMLSTFSEEHKIPLIYIDDLRNQFQRLKRSNYFVKKRK